MKILRNQDGQVLVVTVLGMALFMGLVGLAVDVGLLFRATRQAQIAADAAAIAGALETQYNGSTNVTTVAQNAALANGATNTNQVTVSTSGGGSHTGTGFVQVIVKQPKPTIFMATMSQLLGANNYQGVNVAARAVAGVTPDPACIYLLDPTAQGSLSAKGNFTINAAGCGVDINSNNTSAVCVTGNGNAGTFNSPYVRIRATSLTTGQNCNGTLDTQTFTGASYTSDPLGGITGPYTSNSWSGCDTTLSTSTITSSTSIPNVGVVCFSNFVQISGTVNLNNSNTTAYVFEQGVEVMQNAVVTSSGTFSIAGGLYNANGGGSCIGGNAKTGFLQDSQSTLDITAPSSGFSRGIAIMEPSGDTTPLQVQFGSNTSTNSGSGVIDGLIYAPSATVYLHDNGGTVSATGLIADTLDVCSSTLNITSYNKSPGNASPLNSVQLVE